MLKKLRKRCFHLMESAEDNDMLSKGIDFFLLGLILLNILALILESIPVLREQYKEVFYAFEFMSVMVFSLEYLLRVWSAVEHPHYNKIVSGRLRYMTRPLMQLDLVTILPFFFSIAGLDLRFLRAARLLRVFRLFKLARYLKTLQIFGRVFQRNKEELITTFLFLCLLILFASSLMYVVERGAQPDKFSSIPAAMWWAVATLTTVGYGDTYPVTALGKFLASFIAILGIGMVALPAGILSSAFSEQIKRTKKSKHCPKCGESLD